VNRRPPEHEQDESFTGALNNLTSEERCVCEWRRLGFSSRQIARHQEKSVAAVNALYRQAVAKIRDLVK
jgi:DNA-directed RNA polymerase specialized sigma24 family protein